MKRTLKTLTLALLVMMLLTSLTVPALAGNEEGTKVNSVLEGAVEFNGNYYKFIDQSLTWEQAKKYCEGIGGHLATVTHEEEDAFCLNIWQTTGVKSCWLGASDSNTEGVWQWITGETWSFVHWGGSEPNGGTKENCLNYNNGEKYSCWNDSAETEKKPFLCEWEKEDMQSVRNDYGYVTSPNEIYNNALYFNGNMYKVFDYGMTYDEAVSYCDKLGGHLAIVTSEKEDMALASYIFKNGMQECSIGASDLGKEGVWKWADGSSLTYTNWAPGEPNGKYDYEDHLEYDPDGNWNDARWRNRFACEWEDVCVSSEETIGFHLYKEDTASAKEATCTECGSINKTCSICNKTKVFETAILPHNYTGKGEASLNPVFPPVLRKQTCTECGFIYRYEDWSNIWIFAAAFGAILLTWIVFMCVPREHLY